MNHNSHSVSKFIVEEEEWEHKSNKSEGYHE